MNSAFAPMQGAGQISSWGTSRTGFPSTHWTPLRGRSLAICYMASTWIFLGRLAPSKFNPRAKPSHMMKLLNASSTKYSSESRNSYSRRFRRVSPNARHSPMHSIPLSNHEMAYRFGYSEGTPSPGATGQSRSMRYMLPPRHKISRGSSHTPGREPTYHYSLRSA